MTSISNSKISNWVKIIHVANIRLPTEKAHGIQIMKMSEALAMTGAQVELIVPSRSENDLKHLDPFAYYSVKKNFQIRRLSSFDPAFLRRFRAGTYIKFQLTFFVVSLFFHFLFRARAREIFYTRNEYLLPVLLLFSDKVYWEAHNLPKNKLTYLKYWKKCAGIVAISQGLKVELMKMGIAEEKVIVAHDGVDLANFQFPISNFQYRGELGLPVDKKIVMYAGHLYEWKGASTLLQVAKSLQATTNNLLFVFVGGTEHDVKKFKEQAARVENVMILGHKSQSEIPKYLAAADVLVLPNSAKFKISQLYTSPLKLFEYMASSRPIVASDLPSIREVLNDNLAFFATADDADSLAAKISEVITNPKEAMKKADLARAEVVKYTWQNRAEKILHFLIE